MWPGRDIRKILISGQLYGEYDGATEYAAIRHEGKMNVFQTLMHYGSYALAFYALYVVAGSLAFGYYIWRRVYRGAASKPAPVMRELRDSDSHVR